MSSAAPSTHGSPVSAARRRSLPSHLEIVTQSCPTSPDKAPASKHSEKTCKSVEGCSEPECEVLCGSPVKTCSQPCKLSESCRLAGKNDDEMQSSLADGSPKQGRPVSAFGRRRSLPSRIENESCPASPRKAACPSARDVLEEASWQLQGEAALRSRRHSLRPSAAPPKPGRPVSAAARRRSLPSRIETISCPSSKRSQESSGKHSQNKKEATGGLAEELSERMREAQDESCRQFQELSEFSEEGQLRRQAAEAVQRSGRHSLTGEPWKNSGACAGTVRSASLSRTRGSTTSGLFSDCKPLEALGAEASKELKESSADMSDKGRLRRQAAEDLQRSRRHSLTGEAWKSGGACAGTVRTASLSRSHGSTTSGLFSEAKPLSTHYSCDYMSITKSQERSSEMQEEGHLRRQMAEASQRSQRHSLTGEPWRVGGACAGTVRTASLSRSHGSTTSGLFSDCKPLEASEYESAMRSRSKENSCETQDEGRLRRQAAEATQLSQRHSLTGAPWKSSGACAGTVRPASLSRSHGSTTSGLFSDSKPLDSLEFRSSKGPKELSRDMQDDGPFRRQAAEASQRSNRHSLTGDAWKVGGACAGTVRTACLSRTHGSTTSGLFSQVLLLEGSDCAAMGRSSAPEKKQSSSCVVAGPWRSGGACAGTVRAPSLSRTHGSTVSGLFSDVQPLEGSESLAAMREKQAQRRTKCHKSSLCSGSSSCISRSTSAPSLCRKQVSISENTTSETSTSSNTPTGISENTTSETTTSSNTPTGTDTSTSTPIGTTTSNSTEEVVIESRNHSDSEDEAEADMASAPASPAREEKSGHVQHWEAQAVEKRVVGSAVAKVYAAHCGGA